MSDHSRGGLGTSIGHIVPYHVLSVVVVNIKHWCNDGRRTTEDWRKNLSHSHVDSGGHHSGFSCCLDRFLAFVVWS